MESSGGCKNHRSSHRAGSALPQPISSPLISFSFPSAFAPLTRHRCVAQKKRREREREKGLRAVSKAAIQERHMVVFTTSNIQIQKVVIRRRRRMNQESSFSILRNEMSGERPIFSCQMFQPQIGQSKSLPKISNATTSAKRLGRPATPFC